MTDPAGPTDGAAEEAVDNSLVPFPPADETPGAPEKPTDEVPGIEFPAADPAEAAESAVPAQADQSAAAAAAPETDQSAAAPEIDRAEAAAETGEAAAAPEIDQAAPAADIDDERPTLDDFEPIYRPVGRPAIPRPYAVSPPFATQPPTSTPPILPPPTQLPFATSLTPRPVPPAAGPPSAAGGGGSPRLLGFLVAAIVVLGLGGGVALAAMLVKPGTPSVATASPTSSLAPGASPDSSSGPGAIDILHAFRDKALVKDLTFRMTADGLYTEPSGKTRWNGTWEVSGKDYHVVLKTTGASGTVDAYVIGNKAWLKNTKGKYVVATSSLAEWRWVPFLDIIEIKSLGYGGARTRDGATYHVLASNGWYSPDNGRMLNKPGIGSATTKSLELLVTEDGIPHFATYTMSIDDGGRQVTGTVEFAFTRVGEPITLKVPKK